MSDDVDIKGCLEALGLSEGASLADVKKAYHVKVSEYHPDKVNHLGEKLRAVADSEIRSINEAYHALMVHYVAQDKKPWGYGFTRDIRRKGPGEDAPDDDGLPKGRKALTGPVKSVVGLGLAGALLLFLVGPSLNQSGQDKGKTASTATGAVVTRGSSAVNIPAGGPAQGEPLDFSVQPGVVGCFFCDCVGSGSPDETKRLDGPLYHQTGKKRRLYLYGTYNEARPGETSVCVKWCRDGREIKKSSRVLDNKNGHVWFWIDGDLLPGRYSASMSLDGNQLGKTADIEVLSLKDRAEAGFSRRSTASD